MAKHDLKYPALAGASRWRGLKIGLLGGSFNPAHDAHREISLEALRRLKLDHVWWLVSPGNPLKPARGMAPFEDRVEEAKKIANHPRIHVCDVEARLGTRYTTDTLQRLKTHLPHSDLVWLMGGDNLAQFHRWRDWKNMTKMVPVAIFDRPGYSMATLGSMSAHYLRAHRVAESRGAELPRMTPPAWIYFFGRKNNLSATKIRQKQEVTD